MAAAGSTTQATAIVFGGSGACGRALIQQLLADESFTAVRSVGRRSVKPLIPDVDFEDGRVAEVFSEVLADNLNELPEETFSAPAAPDSEERSGFDIAFCTMGTTIANAGSKERFREIDHDMLINIANQAHTGGVPNFSYVSSIGADADSMFFYTKIKGLNERDLAAIGFAHLAIMRPGILLTKRDEVRPGERVAQFLSPVIDFFFKKHKAIPVEHVARSMIMTFKAGLTDGTRIYENEELHRMQPE